MDLGILNDYLNKHVLFEFTNFYQNSAFYIKENFGDFNAKMHNSFKHQDLIWNVFKAKLNTTAPSEPMARSKTPPHAPVLSDPLKLDIRPVSKSPPPAVKQPQTMIPQPQPRSTQMQVNRQYQEDQKVNIRLSNDSINFL
jgi:hypothetical protein